MGNNPKDKYECVVLEMESKGKLTIIPCCTEVGREQSHQGSVVE